MGPWTRRRESAHGAFNRTGMVEQVCGELLPRQQVVESFAPAAVELAFKNGDPRGQALAEVIARVLEGQREIVSV